MNGFASISSRLVCLALLAPIGACASAGSAEADSASTSSAAEATACPPGPFVEHMLSSTTSWFLSGDNAGAYKTELDAKNGVLGQPAISIASLADGAPAAHFGTAMHSIDATAFRGKKLSFSANVGGVARNGWGGLWMRVDDAQGNVLSFDNMHARPLLADVNFEKRAVAVDVPLEAKTINYGVLLDGAGKLTLNDAALEIVESIPREQDPASFFVAGSKPNDYTVTTDATASLCGRPSVQISSHVASPSGFGTAMQTVAADDYKGKLVRLRASVKAETSLGWVGLWMRVDDAHGNVLSFDNMQNRPLKDTNGSFEPVEIELDVPSNAAQIAFGILIDGKGYASMNGARLEVWGPNVLPTKP